MVDEIKEPQETAVVKAPSKVEVVKEKIGNAKKAVTEKVEAVKVKAAETKEAVIAKYEKLKADYLLLEEKCKVQARLLNDKIAQSEALAKSKAAYGKAANYISGIKLMPEKKLVYCSSRQELVYGYIETRCGNTVSMREAKYLYIVETPIADIAKDGEGVQDARNCYGVMIFSSVDVILDVRPEAREKLDKI